MKLFRKKPQVIEKKENPSGFAVMLQNTGGRSDRKNNDYIRDGYTTNPVVYRCVKEIATAAASVDIYLKIGDKIVDDHDLLTLLKKPNPRETQTQFMQRAFSDYLLFGNLFIAKYPDKSKPVELWVQPAQNITTFAGSKGLPSHYEYSAGAGKVEFRVNQMTGECSLFHHKTYNPKDTMIGMSPMQAAALSGDIMNAGMTWNNSLLNNSGRPSGILKFKGSPAQDAIERLRTYFKSAFQGAQNAGEIPMLTDDADWTPMDHSPRDMDFLTTMKEMSKFIASVYGVPLPLIDNDASSFNNMQQAKERFWTDTVLPLLKDFLQNFGDWIFSYYPDGDKMEFVIDADSIPALEALRDTRYRRVQELFKSGLISASEAREELGYDAQNTTDAQTEKSFGVLLKKMGYTDDEIFEITGAQDEKK